MKHLPRKLSRLRRKLLDLLQQRGVVVERDYVVYGDLRTKAEWRFEPRGNVTIVSGYRGITWLHGRSSSALINSKEPIFVRVDVGALLGCRETI